jgi:RNA polymerase sigma-70 factor, ECF subfamily
MQVGASLAALEEIYRTAGSRFTRVAAGITRDPDAAADAVHDAFVTCVRSRAAYRGIGELEAWVWRAVVHAALKLVRSRPNVGDPLDAREASSTWEHAYDVGRAIRTLPERQRVVLFMAYYADLDYRTIATALDISEGTVGATLHAARAALRLHLEEQVV